MRRPGHFKTVYELPQGCDMRQAMRVTKVIDDLDALRGYDRLYGYRQGRLFHVDPNNGGGMVEVSAVPQNGILVPDEEMHALRRCAFRRWRSPVSAHRDHRNRVIAIGAKRRLSLGSWLSS